MRWQLAMASFAAHAYGILTPIAAMALFGGAQFDDRFAAFGVPLFAMLIGDIVIGFYPMMPLDLCLLYALNVM